MRYLQDVARQFKDGNFSIHGRDESHPVAPVATAHLESQRGDQHTRSRDNQTSNQIAGLADSDNESATQPGESGIPFDQLGIQPSTSGIEVGESGIQSGTGSGESGIRSGTGSGESGIQPSASGIEVGNQLGRSMETRGLGNQTEPGARLPLVPAGHVPFGLTTPPRARGRPKRTSRAKKAARNKVVATAKDDSEMYASNLTLATVQTALSNNATYESSASTLSQFKMFDYSTKLKAPIPRKVSSLPATKPLMDPASITRILRPDYIKTCYSKMISFQNKHRTSHTVLAEKDVAYEIVGYGVYSTDTVRTMKGWHQAMKVIKHVENAISWVETIDFAIPMPTSFRVTRETDLLRNVKLIPLLSTQSLVHWNMAATKSMVESLLGLPLSFSWPSACTPGTLPSFGVFFGNILYASASGAQPSHSTAHTAAVRPWSTPR
ncbi:hypothetical protein PF002_g10904 [Phytophthora fragariae]|uniref:Uncharacterized protein n=1 Tax=Phytophthora fragariae TaxID=53985 RepID=A0A6A3ZMU4_9STRA|nr:hypothetical protein PF002_g10904 [Phytophthora fragariae]